MTVARPPVVAQAEWETALAALAEREQWNRLKPTGLGTLFWFPARVIFRSVQVCRNSRILHRQAKAETFARPDISAKVSHFTLSELPEITRWKNNRVCGVSVKRWLANVRRIFSRSIE